MICCLVKLAENGRIFGKLFWQCEIMRKDFLSVGLFIYQEIVTYVYITFAIITFFYNKNYIYL